MIRILITGHGGSSNRGCEAIIRATAAIIARYIRSVSITVLSYDPSSDREASLTEFPNVTVPLVAPCSPKKWSPRWFAQAIYNQTRLRASPQAPSYFHYSNQHFYRNQDLVLSVGGDNFTDDYGGPSAFFRELSYARSHGALTAIWAASVGPFKERQSEQRWTNELRKVDLITVRERRSLEYLRSLGVESNVAYVADPAFLLRPDPDTILEPKPSNGKTVIGVGMSDLIARLYGAQRYVDAFAAFARRALAETDKHLILIPHVVQPQNDDAKICEQLASRLPNDGRVTVVSRGYNAPRTKAVIAGCDYFIGARTHSTIASLSSGVPTLSIAYSTKAYGITRSGDDR